MNTAISPASLPGAPLAAGPSRPRSAGEEAPGGAFSEALDRSRKAVSPQEQAEPAEPRPRGKNARRAHAGAPGPDAAINDALAALAPMPPAPPHTAAAGVQAAGHALPAGAGRDRPAVLAAAMAPLASQGAPLTPGQIAAIRGAAANQAPGVDPENRQPPGLHTQRNGLHAGTGEPATMVAAATLAPIAAASPNARGSANPSERQAQSIAGNEGRLAIAADPQSAPADAVATSALQRAAAAAAAGADGPDRAIGSVPDQPGAQDGWERQGLASADPLAAAIAAPGAPAAPDTAAASDSAIRVAPPVGSGDWGLELGRQLVRLGPGGHREVQLNLNPAHLGALKVTLSIQDNQAQIVFASDHASVRHALELALPQLRTSFADNGISLGQATVGSGSGDPRPQDGAFGQQAGRHSPAQAGATGTAAFDHPDGGATTALPAQGGAVDTFA